MSTKQHPVSIRGDTPINELAQLPNKIMEVAVLEVANVSVQPSSFDIESLCSKIIVLKQQINTLQQASCRTCSPRHRSTRPGPPQSSTAVC